MDILRTPGDIGAAVRAARLERRLTAVEVARRSGRSRDILHRLENGGDISLRALTDILQAMGCALELRDAGPPTLEEMRARYAVDDDGNPA
jgi:transcriptional regulator with XRE-family HTH domain